MKNYLPGLILLLVSYGAAAQTILPVEDEYILTAANCDSLTITAGSYSGPDLYTTLLTYPDSTQLTALINPDYFGQRWDVDGGSELRFYDGFEESAPLLGNFNTSDYPNGFLLNMNVEFLRIEFETGEESSGDGFEMALFCSQGLQGLPLAKFKPALTENWYYDNDLNMNVLRACKNDSFNIAIDPIYLNPQVENQNVDSMQIKWSLGDLAFKRGKGLTDVSHAYTEGNGYVVTVYSQDSLGSESYLKFIVQNSPQPEFTIDENLAFCQNEPTEIVGGMDGDEVVGASANFGETSITEFYGTQLYLPDGNDQNYTTTIDVIGFPDGTTITSATNLAALCVNMEHSYLGDLEMMLTCPDGTGVDIFNSFTGEGILENGLFSGGFGGANLFLGDAYDIFPNDEPGIGFDYCFSDDAEWGTLGEEFAAENTIPVSTFQPGNAMSPGVYKPEGSFESLVGCPVNGEWILTIRDNIALDDGFIFDWSLGFSEDMSSEFYQNELVAASWENNDWITTVNEGSIEVTPPNTTPADLTFNVNDANGCTFSKDLTVQVHDTLNTIDDSEICDLTYQIQWPNSSGDLEFVSGSSSSVTISTSDNYFEVEVPETGDYTFAFNYFGCGDPLEANLTFLDPSDPACLTGIDEMNLSENITLAPNPVKNTTNLSFDLLQSQRVQINITTVDGKIVASESQLFSGGSQTKEINIENFEAGTYLITLKGETFKTSKIVIKQ